MDDELDNVDRLDDLSEILRLIEMSASAIEDAEDRAAIQRGLFIAKEIIVAIKAGQTG